MYVLLLPDGSFILPQEARVLYIPDHHHHHVGSYVKARASHAVPINITCEPELAVDGDLVMGCAEMDDMDSLLAM